jgi:hypothetical protein
MNPQNFQLLLYFRIEGLNLRELDLYGEIYISFIYL